MEEKFEYNYNTPTIDERREIENIKNQYLPKNKTINKVDRIRYLHNKVINIPMVYGISFGVFGTLLFGVGLTFFLEWIRLWVIGLAIGIFGVVLIALAYPVYKKIYNFYKNKYSEEIIKLSNELLEE